MPPAAGSSTPELHHRPAAATLDFDHPLAEYTVRFKDLHARNVSEYFDDLVRRSGVDEQENARLVRELRELEGALAKRKAARNGWWSARAVGITVAVVSVVVAFAEQGWTLLLLVLTAAAFVFDVAKIRGRLAGIRSQLQHLEIQRNAKQTEAWAQMEPLNRLHTWGVAPALFQATFPGVRLDPYMSGARLQDLVASYGLGPQFPDAGGGRSVLFAQSGSLDGNPFVVQRSLRHWIGTRTYTGSLVIHWTERVRNSDGRYVTVHRSQTLTASVVKPCPMYQEGTALLYGHEAAPALSFSRAPSNLSGRDEGWISDLLTNRKISKLERQARRGVRTGQSQFTVMSNRDFEALFNATDRDDEIAFRLLFTPLAQQEMVHLLQDRTAGFGDDFFLSKQGAITVVEPRQLHGTRFDADPALFQSLELAAARRVFQSFHEQYFRSLYFGLAPLLAIPLYRETRSIPDTSSRSESLETCEWEHEAMANLIGEASFQHPASITRNVLTTTSTKIAPAVHAVEVTAHGYRGEARVDYVAVRGGDGRIHHVPVPWTEYFSVHAQRTMLVGVVQRHDAAAASDDAAELERDFDSAVSRYGAAPANAVRRGALAAALLGT